MNPLSNAVIDITAELTNSKYRCSSNFPTSESETAKESNNSDEEDMNGSHLKKKVRHKRARNNTQSTFNTVVNSTIIVKYKKCFGYQKIGFFDIWCRFPFQLFQRKTYAHIILH